MTEPKPFPWDTELRATLKCSYQGGSWWRFDGIIMLSRDKIKYWWGETGSPWGRFIWVSGTLIIIGEKKNPRTTKLMPWGKVITGLGEWDIMENDRSKAAEIRQYVYGYLQKHEKLPTPSELKKDILTYSDHIQLLRELKGPESNSYLNRAIFQANLFWIPTRRELKHSDIIKAPYGWKEKIIEQILHKLDFPKKGLFTLELRTKEPFISESKRPRGRPRKK